MKLFTHIKSLLQIRSKYELIIKGRDMQKLPAIDNAWLLFNDHIIDFGSMDYLPDVDAEQIDCSGKYVLPTFTDPHTHIIFAKTREEEFEMRLKGVDYEEIAKRGGGILNSAKKLAQASEDELFESAKERLIEVIKTGTGAIEIKSGYGLTLESELKMLRVARRLANLNLIPVKTTFLGAHAYPTEYKENHQGYIDLLCNEILPLIAEQKLANYIDAFCERGYFSVEETTQIINAGKKYGLKAKVHVNQFSQNGGTQMAVALNALSVDHLEAAREDEINALIDSTTIPTLLPSCSFFLNIPYAPARELMNVNLPVALATDYNPGSTPSGNIPFVLALACIKLKMTPEEAINAATLNSAAAIELSNQVGSITKGKKSNLIVTKQMPNLSYWMYSFGKGNQLIDNVYINGIEFK